MEASQHEWGPDRSETPGRPDSDAPQRGREGPSAVKKLAPQTLEDRKC
jgi:hypothetical protein